MTDGMECPLSLRPPPGLYGEGDKRTAKLPHSPPPPPGSVSRDLRGKQLAAGPGEWTDGQIGKFRTRSGASVLPRAGPRPTARLPPQGRRGAAQRFPRKVQALLRCLCPVLPPPPPPTSSQKRQCAGPAGLHSSRVTCCVSARASVREGRERQNPPWSVGCRKGPRLQRPRPALPGPPSPSKGTYSIRPQPPVCKDGLGVGG